MKQLQLRNGDLVLGPGGFVTISGAQKVSQDLGVAVREAIGTDRFHPRWGTIMQDFVGGQADIETLSLIKAEVARVIANYIVVQSDQIVKDSDLGRRPRYTPNEIVTSVRSIEIQQTGDRLNVKVAVSIASGSVVEILRSVSL